jgi:hypothetical protein
VNNPYQEARSKTDLRSLFVGYGVKVRGARAQCPIPACDPSGRKSLCVSIYKDKWYCFRCGAHGDAINLLQSVEGIGARSCLERLGVDVWGSSISIDRPVVVRPVRDHLSELRAMASKTHAMIREDVRAEKLWAEGMARADGFGYRWVQGWKRRVEVWGDREHARVEEWFEEMRGYYEGSAGRCKH